MLQVFRKHQKTVLWLLVIAVGGGMAFFSAGGALRGLSQRGKATREPEQQPLHLFGQTIPFVQIVNIAQRLQMVHPKDNNEGYTRNDVGQRLMMLMAAERAGVRVSEQEARVHIARAFQQQVFLEYVLAPYATFRKEVIVEPAEVQTYYSEHKDEFRSEEGDDAVETLDEVKDQIEELLRQQKTEQVADQALAKFLEAEEEAAKADPQGAFEQAAEKAGLTVETVEGTTLETLEDDAAELSGEPRLREFVAAAPAGQPSPVFKAGAGKFVVRVTERTSGYSPEGGFRQGEGWQGNGYAPKGPRSLSEYIRARYPRLGEQLFFQTIREDLTLSKFSQLREAYEEIPDDVLYQMFLRDQQKVRADFLRFLSADFAPTLQLNPQGVKDFYEQRRDLPREQAGYQEALRVKIEYVLADLDELKQQARAALTDQQIEEYYSEHKASFADDAEAEPREERDPADDSAADGNAVAKSLSAEMKERVADRMAEAAAKRKASSIMKAAALADSLLGAEQGAATPAPQFDLKAIAESFGLRHVSPAPFSRDEARRRPDVRRLVSAPDFLATLFAGPRRGERPISEIMSAGSSRFFYHLIQRIAPRSIEFADLPDGTRRQVERDYREHRAMGVAIERVREYARTLTAAALQRLAKAVEQPVSTAPLAPPPATIKGLEHASRFAQRLRSATRDFLLAPFEEEGKAYCGYYTAAPDGQRTAHFVAVDLAEFSPSLEPTEAEVDDAYLAQKDTHGYRPFEEVKEDARAGFIASKAKRVAGELLEDAAAKLRAEPPPPMAELADESALEYKQPAAFAAESAYDLPALSALPRFVSTLGQLDEGELSSVLRGEEAAYLVRLISRKPDGLRLEYLASPYEPHKEEIEATPEEVESYYDAHREDFLLPVDEAKKAVSQKLSEALAKQTAFEKFQTVFRRSTAAEFGTSSQQNPLVVKVETPLELKVATGRIEPQNRLPLDLRDDAVTQAIRSMKPGDISQPIVSGPPNGLKWVILLHLVSEDRKAPPAAEEKDDKPNSADKNETASDRFVQVQYIVIRQQDTQGTRPETNDAELAAYYEAHKDKYKQGPTVKGELLYLSALRFRPLMSASDEQVKQYYEQHKDEYPLDFEDAKDYFRGKLLDERAQELAVLALKRVRAEAAVSDESLKTFEKAGYIEYAETDYFENTQTSFPVAGLVRGLAEQAFKLKDGQISPPLATRPAGAVIFRRIGERPAGVPPLDEVKGFVRADVIRGQGAQLAKELAEKVRKQALGESSDADACAKAVSETMLTVSYAIKPTLGATDYFTRPLLWMNRYTQYQPRYYAPIPSLGRESMLQFANTAFALRPGQIAGPIREQGALDACYLVRPRSLRQPSSEEFEQAKESLRSRVQQTLQLERWMASMRYIRDRAKSGQ